MLETQKGIILPLSKAGKTKNEIAVQMGCFQSDILKIRLTCSKWLEMNIS